MLPIIDEIQPELYFILRHEIEQTFGKRITTSRDCIELADEIYQRTSFKINANTLRRFFSLVKSQYPPSTATKNILTLYCGFSSFDELAASKKTLSDGVNKDSAIFLKYLITLFKDTYLKHGNDETFTSIVMLTIKYLVANEGLAENFQRAISKTKSGREYYYEKLPNIDKLNSFYGDGLRYYINESRLPEKKIYGYSLLCLRDWLNGNDSGLKTNFDVIRRLSLSKSAPQFIQGRYFAAHLLYISNAGINSSNVLAEAYKTHIALRPISGSPDLSQTFEYSFSEALILTGNFEQALYYIDFLLSTYPQASQKEQPLRNHLLLLKAIAKAKIGVQQEAEAIYYMINVSQFSFLSKKMSMVLALMLSRYIKAGTQDNLRQITELIDELGFLRLRTLLGK